MNLSGPKGIISVKISLWLLVHYQFVAVTKTDYSLFYTVKCKLRLEIKMID